LNICADLWAEIVLDSRAHWVQVGLAASVVIKELAEAEPF